MRIILKKMTKLRLPVLAATFLFCGFLVLYAPFVHAASGTQLALRPAVKAVETRNSFTSIIASFADSVVEDLSVSYISAPDTFSNQKILSPAVFSNQKVLREKLALATQKTHPFAARAERDANKTPPEEKSLAAASLAAVSSFTNTISAAISESVRNIIDSFRDDLSVSASASPNPPAPAGNTSAANDSATVPLNPTQENNSSSSPKPANSTGSLNSGQANSPRATPNVVERVIETQRIVSAGGISEDALNQRLEQLYNKLTSQMAALTAAQNTQSLQTYQVIAQTNRINQLSSATITGSSFAGSVVATTLTSSGDASFGSATTSSLFSTTASSTNLFSQTATFGTLGINGLTTFINGFLSSASSTITAGLFSMMGGASTTNLTASGTGYFGLGQFTNTSGTTTIASGQGLTVGSSQFVVQQGSGNVGIGTTSPSTTLGLVGSEYLTGGFGVGVLNTTAGTLQTSGAGAIGGNLTVSGTLTNLQQASTTILSSYGPSYFGGTATSSFSSAGVLTLTSALAVTSGGTGQTSFGQGWLSSNGTTLSASTSPTVNYIVATSTTLASAFPYASSTALTVSGTGYFGTASTTNLTVSGSPSGVLVTNASGAVSASTTLGVNLGGTGAASLNNLITLGDHTTGNYVATLANAGGLTIANSGTETAAVTVGLNLANSNTWTALQKFFGAASSTLFSNFGTAYFGGTATSTFDSAGNLSVAGTLGVTGNTTLANATTTNLFSTTASSTNLFSQLASLGSVSLTSALAVTSGGTGASTLTGILKGNGTSAFTAATAGTDYAAPGTASSWTALQQFQSAASTTMFSAYGPSYFGGSATSSFSSAGALTLTSALAVTSGGTGQTSFGQGWLSSNGTTLSASTSPTVNYIVATSTTVSNIFASTTTAPYFALSVLGVAGSPALTFTGDGNTGIWSSGADTLNFSTGGSERVRVDSSGSMGIGTTTPWLALSVKSTNASGQFVASYDDSTYATFAVDATGDLKVTAKGGDIRVQSENFWICDNNGCPTLTATSTAGNVFVENAITFGNGFSMASTTGSTSELGLYNGSGQLVLIFDDGA